jgi:hypothetical protein
VWSLFEVTLRWAAMSATVGERPRVWVSVLFAAVMASRLLQPARHPDRPGAVTEVTLDLTDDGRDGKTGEVDAEVGVDPAAADRQLPLCGFPVAKQFRPSRRTEVAGVGQVEVEQGGPCAARRRTVSCSATRASTAGGRGLAQRTTALPGRPTVERRANAHRRVFACKGGLKKFTGPRWDHAHQVARCAASASAVTGAGAGRTRVEPGRIRGSGRTPAAAPPLSAIGLAEEPVPVPGQTSSAYYAGRGADTCPRKQFFNGNAGHW